MGGAARSGAGDGDWKCVVRYVAPEDREQNENEIGSIRTRGTTNGGTQHVVVCHARVGAYGNGEETANYAKLIGVTSRDHSSPRGMDIVVPVFSFAVTKVWPGDGLPSLATLADLTATVNEEAFTVTDTLTGLTITLQADEYLFFGRL